MSEMDTLLPDGEITIGGETLVLTPIKLRDVPKALRLIRKLGQPFMDIMGSVRDDRFDFKSYSNEDLVNVARENKVPFPHNIANIDDAARARIIDGLIAKGDELVSVPIVNGGVNFSASTVDQVLILVEEHADDLYEFMALCLGKDVEFVSNLDMYEGVQSILVIIDKNFDFFIKFGVPIIKQMMSLKTKATALQTAISDSPEK